MGCLASGHSAVRIIECPLLRHRARRYEQQQDYDDQHSGHPIDLSRSHSGFTALLLYSPRN